MPDPNLPKLAELSGGGYFQFDWGADLKTTFARIADELHHQYILGFSPTTLDGSLHNINVKVRQPGAFVRARKTYLAAQGSWQPTPSLWRQT